MERQPNPSWEDLEMISGDYAALYQREDPYPPGRSFFTHVAPFQIDDKIPTEAEVEA